MKKKLKYTVISSVLYANEKGLVVAREEKIVFEKGDLRHEIRKVEIWEENKKQPVVLLTNNFEFSIEDLREIYRRRWAIEILYRQLKQNFQLHFFFGDSVNAIQIQTWVVLIANLLCTVIERKIKRHCAFSQIVTMLRQTLMYYIDFIAFMEIPNKGWQNISEGCANSPPKTIQYSLNLE
jgi:IS4 transposase